MLRLIGQFDPCRRVIARPFPSAHVGVDISRLQASGDAGREQEVVNAQPRIAGIGVPEKSQKV